MGQVEVGKLYRHYKGNTYYILAIAYDANGKTKIENPRVIYSGADGRVWHRPLMEFTETLMVDGGMSSVGGQDFPFDPVRVHRFELVKLIDQ